MLVHHPPERRILHPDEAAGPVVGVVGDRPVGGPHPHPAPIAVIAPFHRAPVTAARHQAAGPVPAHRHGVSAGLRDAHRPGGEVPLHAVVLDPVVTHRREPAVRVVLPVGHVTGGVPLGHLASGGIVARRRLAPQGIDQPHHIAASVALVARHPAQRIDDRHQNTHGVVLVARDRTRAGDRLNQIPDLVIAETTVPARRIHQHHDAAGQVPLITGRAVPGHVLGRHAAARIVTEPTRLARRPDLAHQQRIGVVLEPARPARRVDHRRQATALIPLVAGLLARGPHQANNLARRITLQHGGSALGVHVLHRAPAQIVASHPIGAVITGDGRDTAQRVRCHRARRGAVGEGAPHAARENALLAAHPGRIHRRREAADDVVLIAPHRIRGVLHRDQSR